MGLDRFVLVGMSMGAINALAFAVSYVEKLSALVLIDAGPEVRRRGSSRIRDFVNGSAKPESLDAIIERALAFNPRRDPKVLRRSLMHNLRQQSDGTWVWKYDRRRFQQMGEAHAAERQGLAEGLAKVTCPALVVRGAESDVFHEEDGERLAQRLPDGRFITIPRAGHTVQGDNPKDLAAALREFLAAP
jgi:pimeloyl-ACP methyl ester carboxylesterase